MTKFFARFFPKKYYELYKLEKGSYILRASPCVPWFDEIFKTRDRLWKKGIELEVVAGEAGQLEFLPTGKHD